MSLFFLRRKLSSILGFSQATYYQGVDIMAAIDNLTAAVTAAVAALEGLEAKVTALTTQVTELEAQIAVADNSAAIQAEVDQLNAAVAANPIPA